MNSNNIPNSIPNYDSLERRFRLFRLINLLLLAFVILTDIYLCWKIFFVFQNNHLMIRAIITLAVLTCLFLLFVTKPLTRRAKVQLKDSNENHIGNYSKDELLNIIQEILKPNKLKELPKIYIFSGKEADVSTMNSLFLNFIKFLNAIFISSIVFHLLNKKELKAIMGHELGHFYKYQLHLERAIELIYLLIGLLTIYVYFVIGIFKIWMLLVILVLVYFAINILVAIITLKFENTLEYLADFYAAKRFGKLNLINGLMTVVKSSEITEYLYKKIIDKLRKSNGLSHLDYDGIVAIVMNKLPEKLMSRSMLNKFIDDTFNSKEIAELRRDTKTIDKVEKAKFIRSTIKLYHSKNNFKIIDWNLFDFNNKDFKIDEVEYPYLIKSLIEHPEEQMFDLVYDNRKHSKMNSHPTVRERILFLEKNLPDED